MNRAFLFSKKKYIQEMQKKMIGTVYAITSARGTYIGSTCKSLARRLSEHMHMRRRWLAGEAHFTSSFDVLAVPHTISELERGEFNTPRELRRREGTYIRERECVNRSVAGRTPHEYFLENRARRIGFLHSKKQCECGCDVSVRNLARHRRTSETHKKNIADISNTQ